MCYSGLLLFLQEEGLSAPRNTKHVSLSVSHGVNCASTEEWRDCGTWQRTNSRKRSVYPSLFLTVMVPAQHFQKRRGPHCKQAPSRRQC